ncbi:hypothetical protein J437_LFUL001752 [Ladona fulva]|uniref:Integrase zinc-binding domain-containing protein n=1 Tax=Ladona fulva TaxID=123851 RepID=A0A8K0JVW5_LADFU|nr:hypothetical protein J437_LFUL001752 [Ladona fulva]
MIFQLMLIRHSSKADAWTAAVTIFSRAAQLRITSLEKDVTQYVQKCLHCNTFQDVQQKETLISLPVLQLPW